MDRSKKLAGGNVSTIGTQITRVLIVVVNCDNFKPKAGVFTGNVCRQIDLDKLNCTVYGNSIHLFVSLED